MFIIRQWLPAVFGFLGGFVLGSIISYVWTAFGNAALPADVTGDIWLLWRLSGLLTIPALSIFGAIRGYHFLNRPKLDEFHRTSP